MSGKRARWLGWGLLAGTAAGLVWAWQRAQEMAHEGPPKLLDWDQVRAVAVRFCRGGGVMPGQAARYAAMVSRSVEEVTAYTGLEISSSALAVRVLDRRQWLEANLDAFQAVLAPLEELYDRASPAGNLAALLVGRPIESLMSRQVGVLLGYLAQKVLGQYDIALLGREPLQDGQLYFVAPNIRLVQAQLGLSGSDFPLWVALHETTHAFEFEAHPWLRDHFNGLLKAFLADLEPEVEHVRDLFSPAGLADVVQGIRQGDSWLLWALTPRQRDLFDQMQALMCIVEGYSNHVMKRVGRRILPSFDLIETRVAERQAQRTTAERLLGRLTGMDLKMEQYRLGEAFAEAVVEERGLAFLNRMWEGPETMPALEEIAQPGRWIERMEG